MQLMDAKEMSKDLKRLNPELTIVFYDTGLHPATIVVGGVEDIKILILPEGYYIFGENGLTNKINADYGQFRSFKLMTVEKYEETYEMSK